MERPDADALADQVGRRFDAGIDVDENSVLAEVAVGKDWRRDEIVGAAAQHDERSERLFADIEFAVAKHPSVPVHSIAPARIGADPNFQCPKLDTFRASNGSHEKRYVAIETLKRDG